MNLMVVSVKVVPLKNALVTPKMPLGNAKNTLGNATFVLGAAAIRTVKTGRNCRQSHKDPKFPLPTASGSTCFPTAPTAAAATDLAMPPGLPRPPRSGFLI